jgi:hypothetical protein
MNARIHRLKFQNFQSVILPYVTVRQLRTHQSTAHDPETIQSKPQYYFFTTHSIIILTSPRTSWSFRGKFLRRNYVSISKFSG